MKKSLLALAVLGTFAGAASAQSNVTVYGVVDAGIEYSKVEDAANEQWSLVSGGQSGSRLGFRGTEDLGGGLKGIFTLESGFNVDQGTISGNRLFSRQAFVGLQGGFGTVKLGRQQTPMYYALLRTDPFAIGTQASAQRYQAYGLAGAEGFSRTSNTLSYSTNNMGGFTGEVHYSFGESDASFKRGRNIGAGLGYMNGPISVQFAYQTQEAPVAAVEGLTTADRTSATGVVTRGTAGTTQAEMAYLGAAYNLGVVKLHAGASYTDLESTTGARTERNVSSYMFGVSAPVGVGTVLASWNRADLKNVVNGEADAYSLGYIHPLSKRTNFYTVATVVDNDDGSSLSSGVAGKNDRIFRVGVRHTF